MSTSESKGWSPTGRHCVPFQWLLGGCLTQKKCLTWSTCLKSLEIMWEKNWRQKSRSVFWKEKVKNETGREFGGVEKKRPPGWGWFRRGFLSNPLRSRRPKVDPKQRKPPMAMAIRPSHERGYFLPVIYGKANGGMVFFLFSPHDIPCLRV